MNWEKSESRLAVLSRLITAAEANVDAAVYRVYGLSSEEIALVEQGPKDKSSVVAISVNGDQDPPCSEVMA
jgi:hypothetical protein